MRAAKRSLAHCCSLSKSDHEYTDVHSSWRGRWSPLLLGVCCQQDIQTVSRAKDARRAFTTAAKQVCGNINRIVLARWNDDHHWRRPKPFVDLLRERVRSGIAAARKRGVVFGRRPGQRVKSDRLAPKVLQLVGAGQSYREISHRLGLSKNTVLGIVKRDRAA